METLVSRRLKRIAVTGLLFATAMVADPILHKLDVWKVGARSAAQLSFYTGWTNGLMFGLMGSAKTDRDFAAIKSFGACVETMSYDQAAAMIDKYVEENPEKWNRSASDGIFAALTAKGGPCDGKSPWHGNQ